MGLPPEEGLHALLHDVGEDGRHGQLHQGEVQVAGLLHHRLGQTLAEAGGLEAQGGHPFVPDAPQLGAQQLILPPEGVARADDAVPRRAPVGELGALDHIGAEDGPAGLILTGAQNGPLHGAEPEEVPQGEVQSGIGRSGCLAHSWDLLWNRTGRACFPAIRPV